MTRRARFLPLAAAGLAACGASLGGNDGGTSTPIRVQAATEVVACRARIDDGHRFAEIALRDLRNLGTARVTDLAGPELRARVAADAVRVVFARERDYQNPGSRELFVATLDGSAAEQRLTQNAVRDDEPCWAPDGRVLFTSERDGATGLWLVGADGSAPTPFLPVPAGHADGEADWHRGLDRVVWSRRDPDGHHYLCVTPGSGVGATQLTDGGPALGDGTGDHDPAFTPDGSAVVFVRRIGEAAASLCLVPVATGVVTPLLVPAGEVALPRVMPQGDRVLFGLAEPALGRQTLRLAMLPLTGGDPVLVWPDERWRLQGLDVLPTAPAATAGATPLRLDVETQAEVQVAYATAASGTPASLREDDGDEFYLQTQGASTGRQVAGLNVRFDLPVADAEDVLELRLQARVRCSRVDAESFLRVSIYNPSDNRFDTAVELTPTSTDEQTMTFRTSSLRHVPRERNVRLNFIFDLPDGDPADCRIDLVELVMVTRQGV
ncbi:MAG: PD40 domain-containing protein [Planctomycetes bacterium]|nr:PD40 domain-containing protein [Planctomycetota bacterium]